MVGTLALGEGGPAVLEAVVDWDQLPQELLRLVVELARAWVVTGWCPALRLVCSRWQALHDAGVHELRFYYTVGGHTALRDLDLNEALSSLCSRMPALTSVTIVNGAVVTDEGLGAISELTSLSCLSLPEADLVTEAGLATLHTTSLTNLNLSGCSVNEEALLALLQRNPGLQRLDLAFTKLSDKAVSTLAALHALKKLDVSGSRMTTTATERLRGLLPTARVDNNDYFG
jgi:hypothetical protein